jgi:hypothetical protein
MATGAKRRYSSRVAAGDPAQAGAAGQESEESWSKPMGVVAIVFKRFGVLVNWLKLSAAISAERMLPVWYTTPRRDFGWRQSEGVGALILVTALMLAGVQAVEARTQKPPLHGRHWMAVTGKPLAATAGAMIFQKGGNAVDAACAMIAATSTMWDTLSWGGETQALIYNPNTGKVIGINALGVAPTGATPEFGPLAAVTPGTPGGLMTMLAEYGTLSLAEVLAPAIEMADGYPIEAELSNTIEKYKDRITQWPYSK